MNEGQKLTLQMSIFFLISFVLLGTLVIKEKQNVLFLPKIETSITNYISEKYKDLDINKSKITEKDDIFKMKVTNNKNKNHYFYINYSKKNITDTYKTDYLEGKTILNHLSDKLEKDIESKTNKKYKITFDNTLNNYSNKVQDKILEEDINTLKIYTAEKEIATTWDIETITNKISDTMSTLDKNNFTPKNYTITITNINDITTSIKIYNLKSSLLEKNKLHIIINDIINNKQSSIIKENKITYEYLN